MKMVISRSRAKSLLAVFILMVLGTATPLSSASSLIDAGDSAQPHAPVDWSADRPIPVSAVHEPNTLPANSERAEEPSATTEQIITIFGIALFVLVGVASWLERPKTRRKTSRSEKNS